jgi:DnaJ like chaperone protein
VDPLTWLGLRSSKESRPNLNAIHAVVRQLLPDDEPVVHRYIVVVAILLTQVAQADGVFLPCEVARLTKLFEHVDRLPKGGIGELCTVLDEHVPRLSEYEIDVCYRELKSLCDASERRQVMRLLASQATVDGSLVASEHDVLVDVATHLGIDATALAALEDEARESTELPLPPDSIARPSHAKRHDSSIPESGRG